MKNLFRSIALLSIAATAWNSASAAVYIVSYTGGGNNPFADSTDSAIHGGSGTPASPFVMASLRGAVAAANANPGSTIRLPIGTYNLTIPGGVTTTQGSGEGFNGGNNDIGDLDVKASGTTITGLGTPANTIIKQNTPLNATPSYDRVIEVNPALSANFIFTIENVTLTGGNTPDGGGAIVAGNQNNVTTITNCVLADNHSFGLSSPGGAIFNIGGGNLVISGTTFQNNGSGPSSGGAIAHANAPYVGQLQLTNCTFTGNSATGAANSGGGAVSISDLADQHTITNCTFTNNTAPTASAGGGA
ncbi:MAG TPA: hypothetical protein VF511_05295, partial [Chthoniobacterales bacterium]